MRQEETTDFRVANERNCYKVELWTADDHIDRLLYAGTNLDRARTVFDGFLQQRRPSARLTIRQRARVLQRAP